MTSMPADLTASYREVLAAVISARPSTVLPPACRQVLDMAGPADMDVLRAVWKDLTGNLRGLVEDAGYDADLLPAPPRPDRTLTIDASGTITLVIPDPDSTSIAACRDVPGAAWQAAAGVWAFPEHPAIVPGLRVLVRSHRVVPDAAAVARLRELAARTDEQSLAVATVTIRDGRVRVIPAVTVPALADRVKRVPSIKWDGTAFSGPMSRLREVLAAVDGFPVVVEDSVRAELQSQDAPLVFDGSWDGLRAVPVTDLKCVDGKRAERFAEFGLTSVFDLLMMTPRRYLDRASLTPIRRLQAGTEVGLLATVTSVTVDPRKRLVKIVVSDGTGTLPVTYFNAVWQGKRFRVGDEVAIWGKVDAWTSSSGRSSLQLTNPIMDPVGDATLPVIPVYPQSAKTRITTWEIHQAAAEALRRLPALQDPLPAGTRERRGLIARRDALHAVHLPNSVGHATQGRTRLAFDELFRMQAALLARKAGESAELGVAHARSGPVTAEYLASLPYPLTGAQQRAWARISDNLAADHPMHVLLQGDVGAGKTTMALLALLRAVESGSQAALMAPTEILASQLHAELVERTTGVLVQGADGPREFRVAFISNKLRGKNRERVLADLAAGLIDVAVGTHALLVDDVQFARLTVVVVDEQHRFGVEQRAALRAKGPIGADGVPVRPDMLVMTATPIPRTASMTVFGDLDVAVLDELPPGRTPIVTRWIDAEPDLEHPSADPWQAMREQVAAGRQGYVVCPLVEESDKLQVASAVETFEQLRVGALAGLRLGLVHGQQPADERAETMAAFRAGDIDVLVATTVIEVGVNVPNATMIVIVDAGRFGIAQLHQLRGRVGRGKHASSCVLVGRVPGSDGRARMEALVESTDGFYLSEVDLALRGHGQLFGTAQSGQSDLRVADLDADRDLLDAAREEALALLAADPELARHPGVAAEIRAVLGSDAVDWLRKS